MKLPEIGGYSRCINGHHGIVTKIGDSYWGKMIFIIESDGRVYHFPADMLEDKNEQIERMSVLRGR